MEALNMPQVGQDIPKGKIVQWRIAEGEPVKKGDIVLEVESEKAAFEVEATAAGILLKHLHPEGADVKVFDPVAYIGDPGESMDAVAADAKDEAEAVDITDEDVQTRRSAAPVTAAAVTGGGAVAVAAPPVMASPAAPATGRIIASPSAKRIARERGIDLTGLAGSGPNGRIIKRDVLAVQAAPATASPQSLPSSTPVQAAEADEVIVFDRMRQIIADRLLLSRQTIPDFTLIADIDMTPVLAWRKAYNQQASTKVTINDLVVRAVAKALRAFPRMNSHVSQNQMVVKKDVNIGIAVAVEGGLLVPVLPVADALSLEELAQQTKALAADARRGMVKPGAPGTFSISNLGSTGVTRFMPIINPPECAILGVGGIEERIVPCDGLIGTRQMMTVTLVCDHRAVDGAYAGQFLAALKANLIGCGF